MSKSIGSKVAQLRSTLGLTTEQMAKVLNVSAGFLSHIEKDHCTVSPELATQLVGLGVKITKPEYERHNESAAKWMREYRADLKANRKSKRAPKSVSSVNPQLPGFVGQLNNARIEEMVAAMIVERLQGGLATPKSDEFNVTPIFKKKA